MMNRLTLNLLILPTLLAILTLGGCSLPQKSLIPPAALPLFFDGGDLLSLKTALEHQQRYLAELDQTTTFTIAGNTYSTRQLAESLATFQEIVELDPSPLDLDRIIRENFTVYQAVGRSSALTGEMLVTGYYEPVVPGCRSYSPPYIYPLYGVPDDLVEQRADTGETTVGRIDDGGNFLSYWTREEIEKSNILQGYELVYLKDPFDAFLFHIQGSGKVRLEDGSTISVQYRANNGHPYSSIGKLLVDEGILPLEEVNTATIRQYLTENPQKISQILNHNSRYIFFGISDSQNPKGSMGIELTPGRSIAIDHTVLPATALGYLITQKPVFAEDGRIIRWVPLHRFVLPQDSGAAIDGPGRVDLFWGDSKYGEQAAGVMKEKGYLYFLIKNDFEEATE